jgi:hypothetical protein
LAALGPAFGQRNNDLNRHRRARPEPGDARVAHAGAHELHARGLRGTTENEMFALMPWYVFPEK